MSGHHEAPEGGNKKVALLIAILALLLSLAEIGGKQAENEAVAKNIEASNLWAFFQAKTIRGTTLRTAADTMEVDLAAATDPAAKDRMAKRIDDWKKTIARYESEPETNEGRKELMARAKKSEHERDDYKARNENFEIASGLLQIGIVVASASIITGVAMLALVGGGLGGVAIAFMALALFAPHLLF
jgi:small-conductance mechanosensitive channel